MQQPTLSDRQLAQRLKEDDPAAFKEIFLRYGDALYTQAYQKTGCPHDARDLVQEVFLALHIQRNEFEIEESFAPLLHTILRNKIFSLFRKNIREEKYRAVLQEFETHKNQTENTDPVFYKQLQNQIAATVEAMPDRMRSIYRLSKQAGYTPSQISKLLTLSRQTVKNQLSAALKRIREGLDASGFIHLLFVNIHLIYVLGTL